jgi:hypothetical protein
MGSGVVPEGVYGLLGLFPIIFEILAEALHNKLIQLATEKHYTTN